MSRAPEPVAEPGLPEAVRRRERIEGRWAGETRMYPRYLTWPAKLQINIARTDEDRYAGELRVSFGGRPKDMVRTLADVRVTDHTISFVDTVGLNGGPITYRGVFTASGIEGLAELRVQGKPIYAIGRFSARRTGD